MQESDGSNAAAAAGATATPPVQLSVNGSKRFKLEHELGAGSFGRIYSGTDLQTGDAVAVKIEPVACKYPQLVYEARVYMRLGAKRGIPHMYFVGREGDYNVLVMQRLGPNLEELFTRCNRRFSLSTVLLLADKMLALVQKVHDAGFVHRDIKPDNFVVGRGDDAEQRRQLFIIDFGLSKCFLNPDTGAHIEYRRDKSLTGTARYASVRNHQGAEQSRRDDLESLGYVLLYFLKGELPWQNLRRRRGGGAPAPASSADKYAAMLRVKLETLSQAPTATATVTTTTTAELFEGVPSIFEEYFAIVKQLAFTETPDYRRLRRLFKDLFLSSGFMEGGGGGGGGQQHVVFDWEKKSSSSCAAALVPVQ